VAVSEVEKSIILDRFEKEIIRTFHFSLSPARSGKFQKVCQQEATKQEKLERPQQQDSDIKLAEFARSRIVVGTNSCTRALELMCIPEQEHASSKKVRTDGGIPFNDRASLCILSRDVRPASILSHIPYLCHLFGIPILLLPGKASLELGSMLGTKKVAVILFTKQYQPGINDTENKWQRQIDSFIDFVVTKIPRNDHK
jgi:ribosomal protein L7Ae-like RNA K-turn-binding protein